jgi:hypothetical protein
MTGIEQFFPYEDSTLLSMVHHEHSKYNSGLRSCLRVCFFAQALHFIQLFKYGACTTGTQQTTIPISRYRRSKAVKSSLLLTLLKLEEAVSLVLFYYIDTRAGLTLVLRAHKVFPFGLISWASELRGALTRKISLKFCSNRQATSFDQSVELELTMSCSFFGVGSKRSILRFELECPL